MRRRTTLRLAAVALLAQTLAAAPLAAQFGYGQTFTAPSAPSTVLRALTVGPAGIYGTSTGDPMVARIFALDGMSIVGPSIFEQALGPTFDGVAFTPDVALAPGGRYVFLVYLEGGPGSLLGISFFEDTYAEGQAVGCGVASCSPASFGEFVDNDLNGFAVEFGPTSVVPEPATWALLGTGLLALGSAGRMRRRAPQAS